MIAFINGNLETKDPTFVIIECGGLGYLVKITLHTFEKIPSSGKVKLFTHLSIKEDSHTLFGFAEMEEKNMFLLLTSISGIGPGTALTILSYANVSELTQFIHTNDARSIQAIKGVGAKTAQRLILELKDKVGKINGDSLLNVTTLNSERNKLKQEALNALVSLGIVKNTAEKTLDNIFKTEGYDLPLEKIIKQALKQNY